MEGKHAGKFCEPKKLVVDGSSVLEIGVAVGVLLVLKCDFLKNLISLFVQENQQDTDSAP